LAESEERQATLETRRKADFLDSKIELAAERAKAEYPSDVVKYLREHHADQIEKAMDAEGKVDADKVKALIELARTERKNYFILTPGSPSNFNGRAPEPDTKSAREKASTMNRKMIRGG
jgi:hypothetical protein